MKIAVIGGTGLIGSQVVKLLKTSGLSRYSTAWMPARRASSTHGSQSSRNTICVGSIRSPSRADVRQLIALHCQRNGNQLPN